MSACDEWAGCRTRQGYGKVWHKGKRVYTHRLRFFEVFGWWPRVVRHTCDNPPCVNPLHLVPGTVADNNRDRDERGRQRAVVLNHDMPDRCTDHAAYKREQRRRMKAGTWVYRTKQQEVVG